MKGLVCALAVVALAAAGLATAAPERSGSNSQTFTDATGDSNGGPDMSTITVQNDDQGFVTISVQLVNQSDLKPNEGVIVWMDTDNNASTGASGIDYALVGIKDRFGLAKFNGTSFGIVQTTTLQVSVVNGAVVFRINRAELGGAAMLHFYIDTTRDGGQSVSDTSPEGTGIYTYQIVIASAPPPTTTTPTPTTPSAVARFAVAGVGVPHAGKPFVVRARVIVGALSATPGAIGCAAKVGTTPAKTTVRNGPAPYRSCTIAVPAGTTGKTLAVTVLVTYKGQGRTTKLTYKIR